MDQPTPKTGALDSTLLVTMTREDLRQLIRAEVQMAIGTGKGASLNPEAGGSQKPYLTVRETADFARLAPSTIRLYIRKRQLKAQKVGRRVIIARSDLEAFLSRNPIEVRLQ
jgi:excisionase family DNA binding protein